MKTPYLVGYDYGMGGAWGVLLARSEDEIREKFPQVGIVPERPEWMSEAEYRRYRRSPVNIDNPTGWLAVLQRGGT